MDAHQQAAGSKDPAPRAPPHGHGGEEPPQARGASEAERVEGDGASRSTARREAEQAAAVESKSKGATPPQPLPHERVPQPRDVYNEQLERL
jgi:hypothetical protein